MHQKLTVGRQNREDSRFREIRDISSQWLLQCQGSILQILGLSMKLKFKSMLTTTSLSLFKPHFEKKKGLNFIDLKKETENFRSSNFWKFQGPFMKLSLWFFTWQCNSRNMGRWYGWQKSFHLLDYDSYVGQGMGKLLLSWTLKWNP